LVLAEFIDSIDDKLGYWDNVPGSLGYSLARGKAHKLEATLYVATGTNADGSLCTWQLTVAWCVLFMDVAILSKLETEMLLEMKSFSSHNRFRTNGVRDSSFRGKLVQ
jgi:hypothetical protein